MIGRQPAPILGANQFQDPIAIPEGKWQSLENVGPRTAGAVGNRASMSFAREVIPSWGPWDARTLPSVGGVTPTIAGYYRWATWYTPLRFMFDPVYGELSILLVTNNTVTIKEQTDIAVVVTKTVPVGTVLLVCLPGVVSDDGTNPVLRVANLGPLKAMPSLFAFNGITYAFGGSTNGARIESPGDGSSPVNFSYKSNDFGTGNGSFNPEGAAVVRDRVVYWKGSNVYFSDKNDPLTIGADAESSRSINVATEEQESITAVAELSTSADGSPVQSVVACWTRTRCILLLGEPGESNAQTAEEIFGSLQINRLNIEAGCVSPATVVRTPYGTIWAGMDDVWFMPFGSLPKRIGTGLRTLLQGQPQNLAWKLHAEYYDNKYRLAMFAPGQGPDEFSPCQHQWWLDLTDGPPNDANEAKWYGPMVFNNADTNGSLSGYTGGTWCMARDVRAGQEGRLFSLQRVDVPDGQVVAPNVGINIMTLANFDAFTGADVCSPSSERAIWQAGYAFAEGDVMYAPSKLAYSRLLKLVCTTAGTSGVSEPDWDSAAPSLTDGTVTWHVEYWNGAHACSVGVPTLQRESDQVPWSILSREFTLGDPMVDKLLDGAEFGYSANDATKLTYNSHPRQAETSKLLVPAFGETTPNTDNLWTGARYWQSRLLSPDPTKRFRAKSATWQCAQIPGFVIQAGVDDSITVWAGAVEIPVTIPAGFYAELNSVGSAIVAAIATATGLVVDSSMGVGRYALFGIRDSAGTELMGVSTGTKLAQLLGYDPIQGAVAQAASVADFCWSWASPRYKLCPDMQFSGINLRFGIFGRRPT